MLKTKKIKWSSSILMVTLLLLSLISITSCEKDNSLYADDTISTVENAGDGNNSAKLNTKPSIVDVYNNHLGNYSYANIDNYVPEDIRDDFRNELEVAIELLKTHGARNYLMKMVANGDVSQSYFDFFEGLNTIYSDGTSFLEIQEAVKNKRNSLSSAELPDDFELALVKDILEIEEARFAQVINGGGSATIRGCGDSFWENFEEGFEVGGQVALVAKIIDVLTDGNGEGFSVLAFLGGLLNAIFAFGDSCDCSTPAFMAHTVTSGSCLVLTGTVTAYNSGDDVDSWVWVVNDGGAVSTAFTNVPTIPISQSSPLTPIIVSVVAICNNGDAMDALTKTIDLSPSGISGSAGSVFINAFDGNGPAPVDEIITYPNTTSEFFFMSSNQSSGNITYTYSVPPSGQVQSFNGNELEVLWTSPASSGNVSVTATNICSGLTATAQFYVSAP